MHAKKIAYIHKSNTYIHKFNIAHIQVRRLRQHLPSRTGTDREWTFSDHHQQGNWSLTKNARTLSDLKQLHFAVDPSHIYSVGSFFSTSITWLIALAGFRDTRGILWHNEKRCNFRPNVPYYQSFPWSRKKRSTPEVVISYVDIRFMHESLLWTRLASEYFLPLGIFFELTSLTSSSTINSIHHPFWVSFQCCSPWCYCPS